MRKVNVLVFAKNHAPSLVYKNIMHNSLSKVTRLLLALLTQLFTKQAKMKTTSAMTKSSTNFALIIIAIFVQHICYLCRHCTLNIITTERAWNALEPIRTVTTAIYNICLPFQKFEC